MILDDPFFDAQWLRAAGHSCAGGAEIGECLAVARAVRGSDVESWHAAWLAMAERVLTRVSRQDATSAPAARTCEHRTTFAPHTPS
jgi:hypothetical protein